MRAIAIAAPVPLEVRQTGLAGEWLLGVGLALSTATQLRLTSLPVGPGELVLLAWSFAALGRGLLRDDLRVEPYGRPFITFWIVALAVLTLDTILASTAPIEVELSYRPLAAYVFVFVLLLTFVASHTKAAVLGATRRFAVASTVGLGFLFVVAHVAPSFGPLEPWYSFRFRGWAENPNQIAFQLTPIPFLGVYLARRAEGRVRKAGWWAVTLGSLLVGIATFSDALWFAWGVAATCFVVFDYVFWSDRRQPSALAGVVRWVVVPLAGVAALLILGHLLYDWLATQSATIYEEGNQGLERLLLWRHGLQAFATAPLIGLGPGAHSGLAGPFLGAESHNSLIDWASNAGVVGLAGYLLLVGWLALRVWARRDPALLATLVALQSVSFFHYTFRHPVFWFCLAFVAAAAFEGVERGGHVRLRGLR